MQIEEIDSIEAPSDAEFYGGIAAGTVAGVATVALIALLFTS